MRNKTFLYGFLILFCSLLLTGCMVNINVSVTGLTGTGLVLQNNGGDDLVVNANGSFSFITQVATGGTYVVTVKTQPTGQVCIVGNGSGTASFNGSAINVQCATNALQLLAGGLGGPGYIDGTGSAARFYYPESIAVDGAGNAYVADSGNSTIRKISPTGVVTTLAGTAGSQGSADGTGADARFYSPFGIAVDGAGNAFVTDSGNHNIRKISPAGVVTTLAGTTGISGSADGTGAAASFHFPTGIAVDNTGNIYVTDSGNHTIRKISPAEVVTTLAGTAGISGSSDGTGAAARFFAPYSIAVDGAGNAYVADMGNYTIRKISPAGVVTTLAGTAGIMGSADGTGAAASFNYPDGIAVDSAGNAYVADLNNDTIRKISPVGVVTTLAGTAGSVGSADGTGAAATFFAPFGIAVDGTGNVYVAGNHTIRKISPAGGVTTLAGKGVIFGSADGTGEDARFHLGDYSTGIALDGSGNAYVADTFNNTIRKISPAGEVTTLAGTAGSGGSADGTGAAAEFSGPGGIALDGSGNAYVADTFNNTIRKISPTGVVTTLAGTAGNAGSADGTGAAARFSYPQSIAVDGAGNAYVADMGNYTIRKISPTGVVTTLAGTAGSQGSADGTGAVARFVYPTGIAADSASNVYVADYFGQTIRKISPAGVVTTLAGSGSWGSADGTGAAAKFYLPAGIAIDDTGNVYVADSGNHTIRKISPAGVVSTVLGSAGKLGVQLGALPGGLSFPTGVAVSAYKLFVASENSVLTAPNPK